MQQFTSLIMALAFNHQYDKNSFIIKLPISHAVCLFNCLSSLFFHLAITKWPSSETQLNESNIICFKTFICVLSFSFFSHTGYTYDEAIKQILQFLPIIYHKVTVEHTLKEYDIFLLNIHHSHFPSPNSFVSSLLFSILFGLVPGKWKIHILGSTLGDVTLLLIQEHCNGFGLASHAGCIPFLCSWDKIWIHSDPDHQLIREYEWL